jgi:hypothetical protein
VVVSWDVVADFLAVPKGAGYDEKNNRKLRALPIFIETDRERRRR